jgi:UDP-N-acetylmuramate-alanine ligase
MDVEFIADKTSIAPQLAGRLVAGDVVLTLGAGDIYKVGESIVAALV